MSYKKGESGNPKGRPKGSKNKSTTEIKEWLGLFLADHRDELNEVWKELEPSDKYRYFVALMNFNVPKQQALKADVTTEREQIVITNMTNEGIAALEKIKGVLNGGMEG